MRGRRTRHAAQADSRDRPACGVRPTLSRRRYRPAELNSAMPQSAACQSGPRRDSDREGETRAFGRHAKQQQGCARPPSPDYKSICEKPSVAGHRKTWHGARSKGAGRTDTPAGQQGPLPRRGDFLSFWLFVMIGAGEANRTPDPNLGNLIAQA